MPGYEMSRFVEVTGQDLSDLQCQICQDIFCAPLVTSCCQQTFCESCIKCWIDSNRTCPYDFKSLNVNHLLPPPKVLTNRLNKLKIRCAFASRGCPEVTTLDNIESHQKFCLFDKELCKVCGFVGGQSHECVRALLDYKQNMSGVVERLQAELEEAHAQNRNLHAQIDNYMRTIQDLTKDRFQAKTSPIKSPCISRVVNNRDLLLEARRFASSPVVDGHKTKSDVVNRIVDVCKEAVTIKGDRIFDVARFVKEFMDSNYMGDWNCYLIYNNLGFVFHNIAQDSLVEVKFGKVTVTVYKTFDSLGFSRMINFIKAGMIRDFVISKTGFDETASVEIERLAMSCLKSCSDMNQFTDKVTADLMANYGGVWHCFIYKHNFGFYCVRSDKGRFILLSAADVKIFIFQ